MKRDWDLLQKQLAEIEEEKDVFSDLPNQPKWITQTENEFLEEQKAYMTNEARILGHLEMLIDNGYIEGITILRGIDGHFSCSVSNPRLTMAGHDLLDTLRSTPIWESIKSTAKSKGIELSFDAIKALGISAIKQFMT